MSEKAKPARDAFTFSLGGMSTINSFVAAPVIADDYINDRISKILDERPRHEQDDQPDTARETLPSWGRFWLRGRRRAA